MAALYVDGPAPANHTISSAVVYAFWSDSFGSPSMKHYILGRLVAECIALPTNWAASIESNCCRLFSHTVGRVWGTCWDASAQQHQPLFEVLLAVQAFDPFWPTHPNGDVWQRDNGLRCSLGVSRLFLAGMLWREAHRFCLSLSFSFSNRRGVERLSSCGVYICCCCWRLSGERVVRFLVLCHAWAQGGFLPPETNSLWLQLVFPSCFVWKGACCWFGQLKACSLGSIWQHLTRTWILSCLTRSPCYWGVALALIGHSKWLSSPLRWVWQLKCGTSPFQHHRYSGTQHGQSPFNSSIGQFGMKRPWCFGGVASREQTRLPLQQTNLILSINSKQMQRNVKYHTRGGFSLVNFSFCGLLARSL